LHYRSAVRRTTRSGRAGACPAPPSIAERPRRRRPAPKPVAAGPTRG
jgi:hypothetical protein